MPRYDFMCEKCGTNTELVLTFTQLQENHVCHTCGNILTRVFSMPRMLPSRFPYVHNNLDIKPVRIQNRKQEKHEFQKRGLVDAR